MIWKKSWSSGQTIYSFQYQTENPSNNIVTKAGLVIEKVSSARHNQL